MGLFEPIWMTSEEDKQQKALDAVMKISDQQKLGEVFQRAPLGGVSLAALDRIGDQEFIVMLMRTSGRFRRECIGRISEPGLLLSLAESEEVPYALADVLAKIKSLSLPDLFDTERTDRVLCAELARIAADFHQAIKKPFLGFTPESHLGRAREFTCHVRSLKALAAARNEWVSMVTEDMLVAVARQEDIPFLLEMGKGEMVYIDVLRDMGYDPAAIADMDSALREKWRVEDEAKKEEWKREYERRSALNAGKPKEEIWFEDTNDEISISTWRPF
jgi:hypothetical protein